MNRTNRPVGPGRRSGGGRWALGAMVGSAAGWLVFVGLLVGLPPVLLTAAGNPLPGSFPGWPQVITAVEQRNIGADAVIDVLAMLTWALWGQLVLSMLWELVIQVPGVVGGGRRRAVPLVLRPLNGLVSRLVAGLVAFWVSVTVSQASSAGASLVTEDQADTDPVDDGLSAGSPAPRMDNRSTAEPAHGPPIEGPTRPFRGEGLIWPGSALLITAVLGAVERQRRFGAAQRAVGSVPQPLDPALARVEHRLRRRVDLERAHWLTAALRSLAPGGGEDRLPPPLWVEVGDGRLVVRFAGPGPVTVPAPWSIGADGSSCWLPTSTPVSRLMGGAVAEPFPTLVTVADRLLVNLGAPGGVAVVGHRAAIEAVIRSIVYELHYSPLAGEVRIVASPGVCPADAQHLVTAVDGLHRVDRNWRQSRASGGPHPQSVLLLDAAAVDLDQDGSPGIDRLAPDRQPAVLLVGPNRPARWDGLTLVVGERGAIIEPPVPVRASPPPVLSPVKLSAAVASDITALLSQGRPRWAAPVRPPDRSGPTLRLLGGIELVGVDWKLTSQQLSLVSFLACAGSAGREAIVDALWDGRPISRSRFLNLLAELRSKIGREHLPEATGGRYSLDGVGTDLHRFEAAVTTAAAMPDDGDRILLEAMSLVRGAPLTAPGERYWAWVSDSGAMALRIEALIVDTGYRLAERFRSQGDLESAALAFRQGLLACPLDENLVTGLAEVHLELGRVDSAFRLIDGWESKIRRLGCGEPSARPRARLGAIAGDV